MSARLGEEFFNDIIRRPIPLDMHILRALTRSTLGLDLYQWLNYRTFGLHRPRPADLAEALRTVRRGPWQGGRQLNCPALQTGLSARVEEDQRGLAGAALQDARWSPYSPSLDHTVDPAASVPYPATAIVRHPGFTDVAQAGSLPIIAVSRLHTFSTETFKIEGVFR